jgi:hypothetical protein
MSDGAEQFGARIGPEQLVRNLTGADPAAQFVNKARDFGAMLFGVALNIRRARAHSA